MNAQSISTFLCAAALTLGCGGGQPQQTGPDTTRHANTLDVEPTPDARLPVDPVPVEPVVPAVDPNAPLVTFELHNSHTDALESSAACPS